MSLKILLLFTLSLLVKLSKSQYELPQQIYHQSGSLNYPTPIRTAASYAAQSTQKELIPIAQSYKEPILFKPHPSQIPSSFAVYASLTPANYISSDDPNYEHDKSMYTYKYGVSDPETGDKKSMVEEKDGDGTTKGEYSYLQPDGTVLTVTYTVNGDSGFNAIIKKTHQKKPFT